MEIVAWVLIVALMILGLAGALIPVLPGVLLTYASFFVYGWFYSFEPFGFWFWTIQTLIALMILISDYVISAWGVKKFGGSRASVYGSIAGLLIGPFVIPAFGIVLGPLLGGMIGELIHEYDWKKAWLAGRRRGARNLFQRRRAGVPAACDDRPVFHLDSIKVR